MPFTGLPSEQEYIEIYCQARGIAVPDPTTYAFCQALSMFRIAAILAGVGARAQLGNASSKHAAEVCPACQLQLASYLQVAEVCLACQLQYWFCRV